MFYRCWHPYESTIWLNINELGIMNELHAKRIAAKIYKRSAESVHATKIDLAELSE